MSFKSFNVSNEHRQPFLLENFIFVHHSAFRCLKKESPIYCKSILRFFLFICCVFDVCLNSCSVKTRRVCQRFYVYETSVNRLKVKAVLLCGAPGLESVEVYIKG